MESNQERPDAGQRASETAGDRTVPGVTVDLWVTRAREVLAAAGRHGVSELPPSVLMREDAELRRVLGQVLDVIADAEDAEDTQADDQVTQATIWGGAIISTPDAGILAAALADAVHYREPGEPCADCGEEGLCGSHKRDLEVVNAYRALASRLGIGSDR